MIRNNLAILLLERNIKAIQVSNDTGIAQSTLSKISNNSTEKIDYSTINTLCNYLKITPCEFFEYSPIDVSFSFFLDENENQLNTYIYAYLNILKYGEKYGKIEYDGIIKSFREYAGEPLFVHVGLKPANEVDSELISELQSLPISMQTKIRVDFETYITEFIEKKSLEDVYGQSWELSIDLNLF